MKSVTHPEMDVTDGPAPPVDPSIRLEQIVRYCLSDGQAANLALDQQFMDARYRAHQIMRLMEFSSSASQIKLSIRPAAWAFNIDHFAIKCAILRSYADPPGRRRHRKLSAEINQTLVE
jgi:hypothetical protein